MVLNQNKRKMNESRNGCCDDAPRPINEARRVEPNVRRVEIQPLSYGYHVTVGCQHFAIEDVDVLLKNLEAYLKNPVTFEKEWMDKKKLL